MNARTSLCVDILSNSTTPRRVALARMFKEAGLRSPRTQLTKVQIEISVQGRHKEARFGADIIVEFYIDDFIFCIALFIFMKDGKTVNCNGSEIIGLINLKHWKRTAYRDFFSTVNAEFSWKGGKMSTGRVQSRSGYILIELYVPIKTYFYVQIGLFWYLFSSFSYSSHLRIKLLR